MDQVLFHRILMCCSGLPARLSLYAHACSSPFTFYEMSTIQDILSSEGCNSCKLCTYKAKTLVVLNPSFVGRAEVYIIQLTTATQPWLSKLCTITAPPIAKSSFADKQSNKAHNEAEKTLRQGYTDAYVSSATKCSPPSILSLSVPMILCQIMQVARSLQSH